MPVIFCGRKKIIQLPVTNNINAGAAKIVIQGAGAYSGKYETEYTIQKAQNVITAKEITKNASTKKQSANIGCVGI